MDKRSRRVSGLVGIVAESVGEDRISVKSYQVINVFSSSSGGRRGMRISSERRSNISVFYPSYLSLAKRFQRQFKKQLGLDFEIRKQYEG